MVETIDNHYGVKKYRNILSNFNVVVALAAFWVNFCLLGVQRSNAVIFRAFVDVFEVNRQHAAWPSGIFGFFMCVTGALSGFLTNYVSIRVLAIIGAILASASVSICSLASEMPQFIFLYGALQGIGMGLIVPLTHVILNQNFTKYRACALGFAYSGSSAGSFVFPPLTNILMSEFGLQGTFLLLGGIMSNSLIGTLFFMSPRELKNINLSKNKSLNEKNKIMEAQYYRKDKGLNKMTSCKSISTLPSFPLAITPSSSINAPSSTKNSTTIHLALEILCNSTFFIVSLAYAIYFSTSAVFLMVVIDFAKDRGITAQEGVFLISAFSIGDFFGRLTFGWIADTKFVRRSVLVCCYLMVMGILVAMLPIFPVHTLPAASVLLGIVNGSIIVNHSVLLNECQGIQKLPLAMGFSTCLVGITAFMRPIVIGVFRDRNQNYDGVFLFMGMLQVAVTLVWFFKSFVRRKRRKFTVINVLEENIK